ncbi:putative protein-disulfide isomerase [Acinetobacter baylyi]|uniref:DSBA-like thioredoxin domain-containing protein n=1 Tax=Acinetobacter baylyi TaxID=202950 RepID=A0ABU0URG1_ACIBI|nr:DsbA family protein [Acinetobacter baylyi]MDQ1207138.1 putative protein-disulfide isomerase [Acinetobacter baylyi]MDR6108253.1 putative protein-disulfide isomerase [Acinetobacter baylyi]MDR6184116.1 putative protein-disulfide isomerase [Acinetobacter baylyi]
MKLFSLPSQSIVYVMDAYCGWCWGFSQQIQAFETANRHRINFTAISGGLFVGDRALPISNYPHIPEANQRISRLTGAVFGERYENLLNDGSMILNSLDAGIALAVLRNHAPEKAIHWAHELQHAFYIRGLSLSDHTTITDIATADGLDKNAILLDLKNGTGQKQALADFAMSRALGVSSFPTLLFVDGDKVHQLPATGSTLQTLNNKLDNLLI